MKNVVFCLSAASVVFFFTSYQAEAASFQKAVTFQGSTVCLDMTEAIPGYSGIIFDKLFKGAYPDVTNQLTSGATGMPYNVYCGWSMEGRPAGDYWVEIKQNSTPFDQYFGQFYWDGTTGTAPDVALFASGKKTQFQNVTVTSQDLGQSGRVTFTYTYFLELSELNVDVISLNPQMVNVSLARKPENTFGSQSEFITPWVQGVNTKSQIWQQDLIDGQYEFLVDFNSMSAAFEGVGVLDYTYLVGSFTMTSGQISNIKVESPYYGQQYEITETPYLACAEIDGYFSKGACEIVTYLFVPSDEDITKALSFYSSSSIPWIQTAYIAFEASKYYINSGGSGDAATYRLDYDFGAAYGLTGLTIDMFALSDVIVYIAPYGYIPRSIILTMIIIAFTYMVYNSINGFLSIFVTDGFSGSRTIRK